MSKLEYDSLKLENQLCFPLYAASREIIKKYRPLLDKLNLTYTQYIVMMLLWEKKTLSVKEIGERLYLDSGTLTPLLKKMELKNLLTRVRSLQDERNLIITITDTGEQLKEQAIQVPKEIAQCFKLNIEEISMLCRTLYKILGS